MMVNLGFWSLAIGFTAVVLSILANWFGFFQVEPLFSEQEMAAQLQKYQALNKTCLILGGSGASGKALLKQLAAYRPFSKVILVGRRKLEVDDPIIEQRVIDFDKLEQHQKEFEGADVVYCCLGTTRGTAGADGFVKIEHDYVLGSAKLAKNAGAQQFHLVSSKGADESSFLLYARVKGQVEREISELNFERTGHFRPAMLIGVERTGRRYWEVMLGTVMKPFTSISTPIDTLARAMIMLTVQDGPKGTVIAENHDIYALGKALETN